MTVLQLNDFLAMLIDKTQKSKLKWFATVEAEDNVIYAIVGVNDVIKIRELKINYDNFTCSIYVNHINVFIDDNEILELLGKLWSEAIFGKDVITTKSRLDLL